MKEEKKVNKIKRKLMNAGPMLPGSISKQYNVCGTPGCKCKDPKHPVKHGPYYQLSFSISGRNSSFFIKREDLREAKKRIREYKRFKQTVIELTKAYIDLTRKEGFQKR